MHLCAPPIYLFIEHIERANALPHSRRHIPHKPDKDMHRYTSPLAQPHHILSHTTANRFLPSGHWRGRQNTVFATTSLETIAQILVLLENLPMNPQHLALSINKYFEFVPRAASNKDELVDEYANDENHPLLPYAMRSPSYNASTGPDSGRYESSPPAYHQWPREEVAASSPPVVANSPSPAIAFPNPFGPDQHPGPVALEEAAVEAAVDAPPLEVPHGPMVDQDSRRIHFHFGPRQVRPPVRPRASLARALRLLADHGSPGRIELREARALRHGHPLPAPIRRPPAGAVVRHPVSSRWFYEPL